MNTKNSNKLSIIFTAVWSLAFSGRVNYFMALSMATTVHFSILIWMFTPFSMTTSASTFVCLSFCRLSCQQTEVIVSIEWSVWKTELVRDWQDVGHWKAFIEVQAREKWVRQLIELRQSNPITDNLIPICPHMQALPKNSSHNRVRDKRDEKNSI